MTSIESFEQFWIDSGYQLTLGEILKTHFAAEYRKYISLLRPKYEAQGYKIKVILNRKEPSKNLYVRESINKYEFEGDQLRFT